jgi:predicted Zn-dependent peptidase
VAWKHPDSYALEVLAGIMSGKTGRLYKKLVDEKGIAKSSADTGGRRFGPERLAVSAAQDSKKYAGAFQVTAEGISGVRAEQLEEALAEVIADLKANPVPPEELQKVKNQLRVEAIRFMDLMGGMGVMFQLSQHAGMGDWTEFNAVFAKLDLVTAEDVQRVANKYFADDQRSVLVVNTKAAPGGEPGEGGEDPRVAQFVQMIKASTDLAQLEQMTGMISMRLDSTEDPTERAQIEKLLKVANDRISELKAAQGN